MKRVFIVRRCEYWRNYRGECGSMHSIEKVFDESEDEYIENYGGVEDFVAENHNNGYAELHLDCGWDETIIKVSPWYEINKPTYDSI